jgi:hypothetical protein
MAEQQIKKWVEALESGEYQQAQGQLKDEGGGYCCLGVACDLYRKTRKRGRWTPFSFQLRSGETNDTSLSNLPVKGWLGLDDELEERLISMNDTGSNFKQIAAYVRKRLKIKK